MIGAATAIGAAAPAAAVTSLNDNLTAMAAVSASDAWAVGTYQATGWAQTLIEHWDGTAWTVTASPDPGGPAANSFLYAVAAASASRAPGRSAGPRLRTPLIERWNGRSWTTAASPSPGSFGVGYLYGVIALSARDVWAAGNYQGSGGSLTLVEHWNGTRWRQVPSPSR